MQQTLNTQMEHPLQNIPFLSGRLLSFLTSNEDPETTPSLNTSRLIFNHPQSLNYLSSIHGVISLLKILFTEPFIHQIDQWNDSEQCLDLLLMYPTFTDVWHVIPRLYELNNNKDVILSKIVDLTWEIVNGGESVLDYVRLLNENMFDVLDMNEMVAVWFSELFMRCFKYYRDLYDVISDWDNVLMSLFGYWEENGGGAHFLDAVFALCFSVLTDLDTLNGTKRKMLQKISCLKLLNSLSDLRIVRYFTEDEEEHLKCLLELAEFESYQIDLFQCHLFQILGKTLLKKDELSESILHELFDSERIEKRYKMQICVLLGEPRVFADEYEHEFVWLLGRKWWWSSFFGCRVCSVFFCSN
eukprot:TRINITY_DN2794_c0_g1_i1.p1 TRINITY_DN2794_c0_g1~~TRINITY_DN2794_c0_g1_i1.p1  ORF type:complete len:357 (-),score=65.15 TRINITY_DN2794_c0_g1_i1:258-1328(-)